MHETFFTLTYYKWDMLYSINYYPLCNINIKLHAQTKVEGSVRQKNWLCARVFYKHGTQKESR